MPITPNSVDLTAKLNKVSTASFGGWYAEEAPEVEEGVRHPVLMLSSEMNLHADVRMFRFIFLMFYLPWLAQGLSQLYLLPSLSI